MWSFRKKNYRTDEELAAGYYATGDRELVGDLFEKHVKTVFGVCLFYFRDKDVAKDMVMQIFEKLITDLRRTEVKNFKGWLSFVVRNHCISELRKTKTRTFVPESYLDFEMKEATLETEEAIGSVSDDIMLGHMKNSLHLLKEKQRLCVELFYLKDMSYQQICDQTKLSLNEVKSNIQNGKRNLKLLIEEKLNNEHNAA
jgi:RNA polymerase sigma-70 factor (ECF subfamily)